MPWLIAMFSTLTWIVSVTSSVPSPGSAILLSNEDALFRAAACERKQAAGARAAAHRGAGPLEFDLGGALDRRIGVLIVGLFLEAPSAGEEHVGEGEDAVFRSRAVAL